VNLGTRINGVQPFIYYYNLITAWKLKFEGSIHKVYSKQNTVTK